jgi:hypothetical protein
MSERWLTCLSHDGHVARWSDTIQVPYVAYPKQRCSGKGRFVLYSRFISWFDALSQRLKLVLVLAALVAFPLAVGLVVLLSPLVLVLALVVFSVSVVALFVRARRNQPLRRWGLTLGASLMLVLVFGGISAAMYGGPSGEQASTRKPASQGQESSAPQQGETNSKQATGSDGPETKGSEEVAEQGDSEAAAYQVSDQQAPEQGVEKQEPAQPGESNNGTGVAAARGEGQPAASRPLSYEQRLRQAIARKTMSGDEIAGVSVQPDGTGCKRIVVRHQAGGGWEATFIEWFMQDTYTAVYKDPALSSGVCSVTVNSFGNLQDKYGNVNNQVIYSTTLTSATANKVNWKRANSVNFLNLWTVNYRHPAVERAKVQEQVERAVDCAEDEGLFDVDIGC